MNVITRIAAPLAFAFFAIGAQAQEVSPGDLAIKSTSAGSHGAATATAPASDRSGAVARGDLNLQPVTPGASKDTSRAYSRRLDSAVIVGV